MDRDTDSSQPPKLQAQRPKLSLRSKKGPISASQGNPSAGGKPPFPPPPHLEKLPGFSLVLHRCTPTSSPVKTGRAVAADEKPALEPRDDPMNKSNEEDMGASLDVKLSMEKSELESTAMEEQNVLGAEGCKNEEQPCDKVNVDSKPESTSCIDVGLGEFLFCPVCQKDLTHLDPSQRGQHVNRCCEKEDAEKETTKSQAPAFHTCMLCKKGFKTEQAMIGHVKACAKKKGISTTQLLQMKREQQETSVVLAPSESAEHANKTKKKPKGKGLGSTLFSGVASGTDSDFAVPPPPVKPKKKTKRKLEVGYLAAVEDEQLQLALALSASIDPRGAEEGGCSTDPAEDTANRRKRQKRSKKNAPDEAPPLLLMSAEQAQHVVAQRAEEILKMSDDQMGDGNDDDIPCTPAFGESELARNTNSLTMEVEEKDTQTMLSKRELAIGELFDEQSDRPNATSPTQYHPTTITVVGGSLAIEPSTSISLRCEGDTVEPSAIEGNGTKQTDQPQQSEQDLVHYEGQDHTLSNFAKELSEPMEATSSSNLSQSACEEGKIAPSHGADFPLLPPTELVYPTLWELSSYREKEEISNFYVPALASVVSPVKDVPLPCRVCGSNPCIALTSTQDTPPRNTPPEVTGSTTAHAKENIAVSSIAESSQLSEDVKKLIGDLHNLIGSPVLSDVVITTKNGTEIPAHAIILACRSLALREVIVQATARPISLDFSEFEDESVFAFLQYLYIGSSPLLKDGCIWKDFVLLAERWLSDEFGTLPSEQPVCIQEPVEHSEANETVESNILGTCHSEALHVGDSTKDNNAAATVTTSEESKHMHHTPDKCSSPSIRNMPAADPCPIIIPDIHKDTADVVHHHIDTLGPANCELPHSPASAERDVDSDLESRSVELIDSPTAVSVDSAPDDSQTGGENKTSCHVPGVLGNVQGSEASSALGDCNVHVDSPSLQLHEANTDLEVLVCGSPSSSQRDPEESAAVDTVAQSDSFMLAVEDLNQNYLPFGCDDVDSPMEGQERSPSVIAVPESPEKRDEEKELDGIKHSDPGGLNTGENSGMQFTATPIPTPRHVKAIRAPVSTPAELRQVPPKVVHQFTTPAYASTQLESDDNITPMPDYQRMQTPLLKGECARYGVRALPKRKMIAKLEEIYEYTHPLVDEDGTIVQSQLTGDPQPCRKRNPQAHSGTAATSKRGKKTTEGEKKDEEQQGSSKGEDRTQNVIRCIRSDTELYPDVLLYKPLELSFIQARLKSAGVAIGRDQLADVLDHLCITYTVPRGAGSRKTSKSTQKGNTDVCV